MPVLTLCNYLLCVRGFCYLFFGGCCVGICGFWFLVCICLIDFVRGFDVDVGFVVVWLWLVTSILAICFILVLLGCLAPGLVVLDCLFECYLVFAFCWCGIVCVVSVFD